METLAVPSRPGPRASRRASHDGGGMEGARITGRFQIGLERYHRMLLDECRVLDVCFLLRFTSEPYLSNFLIWW